MNETHRHDDIDCDCPECRFERGDGRMDLGLPVDCPCDMHHCSMQRSQRREALRTHPEWPEPEVVRVSHLALLVMQQALEAQNLEACDRAIDILTEYLDLGGDPAVRQVGSAVYRMRDALRLIADGRGDETDPSKLHLPPDEPGLFA